MEIESDSEDARLAALYSHKILDTPEDGTFDDIVYVAAHLLNTPIAIVSLVDHDRIWFKAKYGIDTKELERRPGLCASAIMRSGSYIVEDAAIDPRTLTNPLVASDFGLRFYAAETLTTLDGYNLGTLCVLDFKPRELDDCQKDLLKRLANQVMAQMETRLAYRKSKTVHQALSIQEEINAVTLSTLSNSLIRINTKGQILSANCATVELFGYSQQELFGQNISLLMPDEYEQVHDQYIKNYLDTGVEKFIGKKDNFLTAVHKDGTKLKVQVTVNKLELSSGKEFIGEIRDVTEQITQAEKLQQLAMFDQLTQCANRHLLWDKYNWFKAQAERRNISFSLVYIDLNNFKPINDEFGHHAGDEVLKMVSSRLKAHLRKTDIIARVGGDEFVLLLQEKTEQQSFLLKLNHIIEQPVLYQNRQLSVSASIGFAYYDQDGKDLDTLLDVADKRMYQNKKITTLASCQACPNV
ncbi:diguanylate cyclase [Catenovulum sp. SM1970]|uniref:sensor domain-containing diguanylate cyclase n=1 Tax=Marinifaba aquimaris TaxID=2741323 RepID=UPI001572D8BB|nr:diguanylate cyclase [Marinifaba aquimaris]NTS77267.1 diguanylate cyclase [Marinifaba aquimaris]